MFVIYYNDKEDIVTGKRALYEALGRLNGVLEWQLAADDN